MLWEGAGPPVLVLPGCLCHINANKRRWQQFGSIEKPELTHFSFFTCTVLFKHKDARTRQAATLFHSRPRMAPALGKNPGFSMCLLSLCESDLIDTDAPPPRRSLSGWSDLWIKSSASSSSSSWLRGPSSWLCCSPPWYVVSVPPSMVLRAVVLIGY